MILIDALYINDGGGKILLDYLINNLEKIEIPVCYLLDKRVEHKIPIIKSSNKVFFRKASIVNRFKFYKQNIFTSIFCFGNIPPLQRNKSKTFTYFHNPMYLETPKEFLFVEKLLFQLKILVIRYTKKNTNFWFVQSGYIKEKLRVKFNIHPESIKILPFYNEFEKNSNSIKRERYGYIYVSNGTPHKNHNNLIESFCQFYDIHRIGKLTLTISNDYPKVIKLINEKIDLGYPIFNIGFVDKVTLSQHYQSSEYHIFPSLTESFGLGLIEALDSGCKVIGADLPYTFEVCIPSIVFDPTNPQDIKRAFIESLSENVKESVPVIKNNISEIIKIIQNNYAIDKK